MITGRGPTRYIGAEAMEHLIGQGVQTLRQTMLKQEATFKEQLRELHRIYNIQKHLMDEMKRGGLSTPPVSCRDRSVKFPADSILGLRGGCQYEDYSYGMPFEGSSSKLTLDCHNNLHGSAHEDINLNVSLDILEKPAAILENGSTKARKFSFDLERLPEEYMDDEVIEEPRVPQEDGVNGQKTAKGKIQFPGDCYFDKRMLESIKSSHKEKVNCTATVCDPQSSHENLHPEHAKVLKRSRCTEEGCLPISEFPDQSNKPSVSSEHKFLGVLSGVKVEKSSGQESRSSRSSDTFSDGSKKKGRASLSLEAEDISKNMRKIQRETQGCIKSQGDSLSGAFRDQKTLMQDFPKSKASSHLLRQPEWPGESFLEGKQAGQLWWKSFQTHKNEEEAHSSKGLYGLVMTKESSNTEGQSPESSFSLNKTIYGIHPPKSKMDSARSLESLSESQAEDITGMWYQSRTDFPYFPQLQHRQPLNALHISPVSSPLGVSWQTPDRVNSNVTYSSSGGLFSMPRDPSLVGTHGDGVSKSIENFGTSSWLTASGGSITPRFSVASTQKQPFEKSPKHLLDGIPTELKPVSSDPVHNEMIQNKVSREKYLKLLPRAVKESLNNRTDRNIGQGCDLGSREALNMKADFSGGGHPRSGIECWRKIAESEKLSISHAEHGLSRAADLRTMQEFGSENKTINSQASDLDVDIELRSESLLSTDGVNLVRTDGFKVLSVPAPCGESLLSSKAMQVRQDIDTCHKASMTVKSTELLAKSELLESENDQAKVESTESSISKTASDDKLTFSCENAEIVCQVKQEHSHCQVGSIDRDEKINPNAETVISANEDGACSKSEVNRPLVAGESLQGPVNLEKLKNTTRHKLRNENLENVLTGLRPTSLLLQERQIIPLSAPTKQQSLKEEGQPLTVEKDPSVATGQPKKLQACVIPESLAKDRGMDGGTLSQCTCQVAESKLLNCSESLHLTKPEEDIIASFGSTVTTVEKDMLRPKRADSLDLCEDGSTQNPGLDLLTPIESSLHLNSKLIGYDPVVIRESSKPLEVVGRAQPVPTSIEYHGSVAIVSHISTLTVTAAHPTRQHSSEACSLLHESSTNVKSRFQHVSRKTSVPTRSSPEETSDDEHSLCLDESANLAASILISLLPNASLPPKGSEKKRSRRPLLKSFSSSADQLAQMSYDLGKCGSCNTLQKVNCSPSVRSNNDAFHCTLQSSSLDQVSNIESMKTERPIPDIDSISFNMKRNDNASHEDHRKQNQDKAFSQKVSSTKRTKLGKEGHHLKTLPSFSSLTTPESLSGESSDVNAHHDKHLLRHGNAAEYTIFKENNFEGEGSNQVIGQQACKPEAPDNSEEENLWSPDSHVESEDGTSKCHSEEPFICIKSWGNSTRKRRMQRQRNPAFHKQQKRRKISPSKLHS